MCRKLEQGKHHFSRPGKRYQFELWPGRPSEHPRSIAVLHPVVYLAGAALEPGRPHAPVEAAVNQCLQCCPHVEFEVNSAPWPIRMEAVVGVILRIVKYAYDVGHARPPFSRVGLCAHNNHAFYHQLVWLAIMQKRW